MGDQVVDGDRKGHERDDGPKALGNKVNSVGHGVLVLVVSIKKMPVGRKIRYRLKRASDSNPVPRKMPSGVLTSTGAGV